MSIREDTTTLLRHPRGRSLEMLTSVPYSLKQYFRIVSQEQLLKQQVSFPLLTVAKELLYVMNVANRKKPDSCMRERESADHETCMNNFTYDRGGQQEEEEDQEEETQTDPSYSHLNSTSDDDVLEDNN